jgi:sugar phosphate isomerase/epimerase
MKISVQLYSLRSVGDFDAQLALARDCGFDWVETVATHELAPAEFAARVAAHGLRVSSMHVSLALLESQLDTIVEACRLSGCPLVVMPWLPMGERAVGGPAWAALGERLAGIGATLARSGLRLAYHNHDFEFLQHDGRCALEWIFGAAPASLLGWEADLGWVCRAGADPWLWLDRFGDRLAAVHAKDIAAPRAALDEDGWAPLGAGIVPWKKLLARLATQVDTIVFEHDLPRDPRAVLQTSRDFLRSELG